MTYLKFTPYLYLIAAAFFLYDGIAKFQNAESTYWLSFGISAVSIFMYFFRRHFAKKFDDQNKTPKV